MASNRSALESPSSPGFRDPVVIAAVCAAIAQILLVWLPGLPLGIPEEWVWFRIEYSGPELAALFLGVVVALPAAVIYFLFCRAGDARIPDASAAGRAAWLTGLAIGGFAWLWVVQEAAPSDPYRLGRAPLVLYYPAFSGYFSEAQQAEDYAAYLAGYELLMAEGDVLHIGTHPPGLTTLIRGLLEVFRKSPALTELMLTLRPASVRQTQAVIAYLPLSTGSPVSRAELATLWTAGLLVQIAAAAAAPVLYAVTARAATPAVAWRVACLWPLIPALSIFLPKSDALFPLLGLSVLALWHHPGSSGAIRAAAAGAVFWFGLTLSLAMLPVAALAGALSLQSVLVADRTRRLQTLRGVCRDAAIAAAVFAAFTLFVWMLFDLNLLSVWSWNYRNHAGFYDVYDRTWWKWLLVNPVELSLSIGLPVVAAGMAAAVRGVPFDRTSPVLPVLCVIGLLWLSGKNAGEAARLWLFLMPWLLWITASVWNGDDGKSRWRIVLALQLAVSFLTAIRVSGFGFLQLAGMAE